MSTTLGENSENCVGFATMDPKAAAAAAAAATEAVPAPPAASEEEDVTPVRASSSSGASSPTGSGKEEDEIFVQQKVGGPTSETAKCVKCQKRYGKSTCSQLACIKCCGDTDCEGHRALREEKRRQDQIFAGTATVNKMAELQRKLTVKPGSFLGEPAFQYLNESLLIWSAKDYLANPKWREDAIRRSEKNKRARGGYQSSLPATSNTGKKPTKDGRKRRFQRIMNELYEASIKA